jgi:hypothetical protein
MPTYTIRTHRSTQIVCILLALLTSYVSFYLLLNLAWAIGFDFDNFPLFPIKPMDPIMSALYYGARTNTSLFILDIPIFLICFYTWWVGAFHAYDIAIETYEESQNRIMGNIMAEQGQAIEERKWGYYGSHRDYRDEEKRENERQVRLRVIPSLKEENDEKRIEKISSLTTDEILKGVFKVDVYKRYTSVCFIIGAMLLSVDAFMQWHTSWVARQWYEKNGIIVKNYYTVYPCLGIGIIVGIISIALLVFGVIFYRKYRHNLQKCRIDG